MKDIFSALSLSCVVTVLAIAFIIICFCISPVLGILVLVVGFIINHVQSNRDAERKKQQEVTERQEATRKAEVERLADIERERLDLERQKLQVQREVLREQQKSPEQRAADALQSEKGRALFGEVKVMEEAGILRLHYSLDWLRRQKATCENGHQSSYGQFELPDEPFGCPVCKSACFTFDEEAGASFRFCENRIRNVAFRNDQELPCLHSYSTGQSNCPMCACASANDIAIQPHNFVLHERGGKTAATQQRQSAPEHPQVVTNYCSAGEMLRSAGRIRWFEHMNTELVTCANGHHYSWGDFCVSNEDDTEDICPICRTSLFTFDELDNNTFLECQNSIKDLEDVDWPDNWTPEGYGHWFSEELEVCPLCAWAQENNYTVEHVPLESAAYNREKLKKRSRRHESIVTSVSKAQ